MGQTTLGADELKVILALLALFGVATAGALLRMRHEWRALRHRLFQREESKGGWSRPGGVAERLRSGRLGVASREILGRLRSDFEAEGNAEAAAAVEAVALAGDRLDPRLAEIAGWAMAGGELRSVLVRLDGALAYLLAFPGRREDPRTFRRYEAFRAGWPAHAAAVREAAGGDGAPPLVALLVFLGLDAREGTVLVAYEGDGTSRYPDDLADPASATIAAPGGAALTHDFALG
jgi:hypothetical protein